MKYGMISKNDSVDDIVLTLTNDREAYAELLIRTKYVVGRAATYDQFRSIVRQVLAKCCNGSWGPDLQVKTSQICERLFCHYYEEASGKRYTSEVLDQFRKFTPKWALHQVAHGDTEGNGGADKDFIENKYFLISEPAVQPEKETIMPEATKSDTAQSNAPTIETKTFIYGRDAANMSDDDIFRAIAGIESEIKALEKVENKPGKLQKKIDIMKDDIAKLVAFVDAR